MILICPLQRGHSRRSISKIRLTHAAQHTEGALRGSSVAGTGARSPLALLRSLVNDQGEADENDCDQPLADVTLAA